MGWARMIAARRAPLAHGHYGRQSKRHSRPSAGRHFHDITMRLRFLLAPRIACRRSILLTTSSPPPIRISMTLFIGAASAPSHMPRQSPAFQAAGRDDVMPHARRHDDDIKRAFDEKRHASLLLSSRISPQGIRYGPVGFGKCRASLRGIAAAESRCSGARHFITPLAAPRR